MKTMPTGQVFWQYNTGLKPLPAHHVKRKFSTNQVAQREDQSTKEAQLKRLIDAARTIA